MIINQDKLEEIEVDSLGFENPDEGEVSVDSANMAFFYEMTSKMMYEDEKSSIVRELTSNCFDAHREINSQDAVIIEGKYEEDVYMINFIDRGVGISPFRWKETFTKYLNSTKRQSNDFLGCMGLGSKSPFSYVDVYYITTIYDGTEYEYMMYKKENGIPGFDTLATRPTTKRNGTTVKFAIEGSRYSEDWYAFKKSIQSELIYFDNVYVKGFDIENNYQIFEADTFKYRTDTKLSEMHVVLGKVKYPINWTQLDMNRINIPVGVKFDIGTLMVTPNRESLKSSDSNKKLLKEGIEKAIREIQGMMSHGYDTIPEVWEAIKGDKPRMIKASKDVSIPFSPGYYYDKEGKSSNWPFKIPTPYLKEFKDTPILIPDNPYFIFKVKSRIKNGRIVNKDKDETINIWAHLETKNPEPLYRTSDFENNKYKNNLIQNGYIIEKKNLSFKDIAGKLGLFPMEKSPSIPHRALDDSSPKPIKKLKGKPLIGEWGNKLSLIKLYRKVITKMIVEASYSYDKMEITESDIAWYKEQWKLKNPRAERKAESLYAQVIGRDETKVEYTNKDIKETGFIVYGINSMKDNLKAIHSLVASRVWNKRAQRWRGWPFRVMIINKSDQKRMEQLPNAYNIEEFIKGNNEFKKRNNVFIEQATGALITPIFEKVEIADIVYKLIPSIYKLKLKIAKAKMDQWDYKAFTKTVIGKELIALVQENQWYNKELVREAEILLEISEDLSIFNKIKIEKDLTYDEEKDFATILLKKGYMPDPIYTLKLTEEELRWMEEWKQMGLYAETTAAKAANSYNYYKNNLLTKTLKEKAWKSYPKSLRQNKLDRTSTLLLETRLTQ